MQGVKLRIVNESDQTASLAGKTRMASPGRKPLEDSHSSMEGELISAAVKWVKNLSESWLVSNQEGSRGQSNFKVRNQNHKLAFGQVLILSKQV